MASHGWRATPGFFAIVLAQSPEDGKLEIPRTVVRQCGDSLAETILLKVLKRAHWRIELTKSNGKIWLQKVWPEFVKHYSLEHGSLLLFNSQGDSLSFRIQIFKKNTLEIKYLPQEMNYSTNSSSTVEMDHLTKSSHKDSADAYADDEDDNDADDEDEATMSADDKDDSNDEC